MYEVGDLVMLTRQRQGLIRYYGRVEFDNGEEDWYGVEMLGRSIGNTDGVMEGVRYFEAKSNCGIFILPTKIKRKLTAEDLLYESELLEDINERYNENEDNDNDDDEEDIDEDDNEDTDVIDDLNEMDNGHCIAEEGDLETPGTDSLSPETFITEYDGEDSPFNNNDIDRPTQHHPTRHGSVGTINDNKNNKFVRFEETTPGFQRNRSQTNAHNRRIARMNKSNNNNKKNSLSKSRSKSTKDLNVKLKGKKLKNRVISKSPTLTSTKSAKLGRNNNNKTNNNNKKTTNNKMKNKIKSANAEWTPIDYKIPESDSKVSFLTPRSAYVPQALRNLNKSKNMKKPPMTNTINKMQRKNKIAKKNQKNKRNHKNNSRKNKNGKNIPFSKKSCSDEGHTSVTLPKAGSFLYAQTPSTRSLSPLEMEAKKRARESKHKKRSQSLEAVIVPLSATSPACYTPDDFGGMGNIGCYITDDGDNEENETKCHELSRIMSELTYINTRDPLDIRENRNTSNRPSRNHRQPSNISTTTIIISSAKDNNNNNDNNNEDDDAKSNVAAAGDGRQGDLTPESPEKGQNLYTLDTLKTPPTKKNKKKVTWSNINFSLEQSETSPLGGRAGNNRGDNNNSNNNNGKHHSKHAASAGLVGIAGVSGIDGLNGINVIMGRNGANINNSNNNGNNNNNGGKDGSNGNNDNGNYRSRSKEINEIKFKFDTADDDFVMLRGSSSGGTEQSRRSSFTSFTSTAVSETDLLSEELSISEAPVPSEVYPSQPPLPDETSSNSTYGKHLGVNRGLSQLIDSPETTSDEDSSYMESTPVLKRPHTTPVPHKKKSVDWV